MNGDIKNTNEYVVLMQCVESAGKYWWVYVGNVMSWRCGGGGGW